MATNDERPSSSQLAQSTRPNSVPLHIIRLRGPWEYEILCQSKLLPDGTIIDERCELPPPGKVTMPCDWGESLGNDFRGQVRYIRRFGCPTNLTSERIDLVFQHIDESGIADLNGNTLGDIPAGGRPARFDVTNLLKERNKLIVDVDSPCARGDRYSPRGNRAALTGGIVGEVRLEIFSNET